jgi:hypothetical protein
MLDGLGLQLCDQLRPQPPGSNLAEGRPNLLGVERMSGVDDQIVAALDDLNDTLILGFLERLTAR